MFHVVLYQPEIPPNTGNLMRLTVNTGCRLHLVHPLGFELDDARMRRAGLDYREHATVQQHDSIADAVESIGPARWFGFSQHGERLYTDVAFGRGDVMLFGPESAGLPSEVLAADFISDVCRIPIAEGGRSLNLANAAAIAIYEGWRQLGFSTS
ncbi:MAG: tRNA (cytidine(34)-2'-O)-methyltransferase [Acidimicrobiia bacterium]|nr:tRNA (cytidine(34)-2'-O)-methyltransferase [Acidimicrobiia bacterium]